MSHCSPQSLITTKQPSDSRLTVLFIGIMSGTSTDGIDTVLCQIEQDAVQVLHHYGLALPAPLQAEILALNTPSHNELHRAALVAHQMAQLSAQACHHLLLDTPYRAQDITAIGVHGQTVRHAPQLGYTIQLNAPAVLAELTKINVIADFRSRDIAAGGQGAPLVPVFHQQVFSAPTPRVILNLGGIANISILRPQQPPQGFDTGPANALLDAWIWLHQGLPYDADGAWAASGTLIPQLLERLLSEPWLKQPAPKSTGRDLFSLPWLQQQIVGQPKAVDVQNTLAAFTAQSVALAIADYAPDAQELVVCGGGAYNRYLLQLLTTATKKPVRLSDELGIGAQQVEAAAFAWLAYAYWHNLPAGQPAITGARHSTVLGAWYKV